MPEMQVRAARGGELMPVALAGPQAVAVMSEAVKTHGVGDVGLVDDDWVYRHHEMGILRQDGAVRESQRFADTAFEADFHPVQNVQRRRSWKGGGGGLRRLGGFKRCDSRMKLSSLRKCVRVCFVKPPSFSITVVISSRRGSTYSGLAQRSYRV